MKLTKRTEEFFNKKQQAVLELQFGMKELMISSMTNDIYELVKSKKNFSIGDIYSIVEGYIENDE